MKVSVPLERDIQLGKKATEITGRIQLRCEIRIARTVFGGLERVYLRFVGETAGRQRRGWSKVGCEFWIICEVLQIE